MLTGENCFKEKQCNLAALGIETTLIGIGEAIFTKGALLWQSDSQKHESLKLFPVILDYDQ